MTRRLPPVRTPPPPLAQSQGALPAEIFHTWSFSLILNECGSDDSELIWLLELQKQRTKRMFNLSPGTFNLSQMLRVFSLGSLMCLQALQHCYRGARRDLPPLGHTPKCLMRMSESYIKAENMTIRIITTKHQSSTHTFGKLQLRFLINVNSTSSRVSTTQVLYSAVTLLHPRRAVPEDHTAQSATRSKGERQAVRECFYHQHKSLMHKYQVTPF